MSRYDINQSRAKLLQIIRPAFIQMYGKDEWKALKEETTGPGGIDYLRRTIEEHDWFKMNTGGVVKKKKNAPMNFAEAARNKKNIMQPNTDGKPMNLPKIEISIEPKIKNFKMAFAMARRKYIAGGGKESDYVFTWKGKKYNILRGDDKGKTNAEKKASLKKQIEEMKKGGKAPRGASVTTAQAEKIHKGNVGGMISSPQQQKINPTTGLAMNRGGIAGKPRTGHMDMRKNGMFYGGMANRKMK